MPAHFTILHAAEIDIIQWEQTLKKNTTKASIYMDPAYLSTITDNWLAVVNADYSVITAIPFKKKWGIAYAYTAPFVQATSIIGDLSHNTKQTIIHTIQKKLLYGTLASYDINSLNIGETKTNFLLPLNRSYEIIHENFTNDLKKNITKAAKKELVYDSTNNLNEAIHLYISINGHKTPHIQKGIYDRLKKYCTQNQSNYHIRSVKDKYGNLVATTLLLVKYGRIYNLLNTVTTHGRRLQANHWLFHKILEEFSNSCMIFDFEGSSIPGIRSFYRGFSPLEEAYTILKYNRLPFPLSVLP
ncbi:MAG: hypothetical protein K2X37_05930 [Chitinophagaceae bacterium]|nr:hypothetical protein [Chitinophagaceae bacterium]